MHMLLTGGSGVIGSTLAVALPTRGDELTIQSRQARDNLPGYRYIRSPEEISAADRIDAIVNLAGAPLAARRWSAAYKREIVSSYLETTVRLLDVIRRLRRPPQVLRNASAIGYSPTPCD